MLAALGEEPWGIKMSIINAIFFICFILFLLSAVGLTLGRLIARLVIPEEHAKRRHVASSNPRSDESVRPWQFLG